MAIRTEGHSLSPLWYCLWTARFSHWWRFVARAEASGRDLRPARI